MNATVQNKLQWSHRANTLGAGMRPLRPARAAARRPHKICWEVSGCVELQPHRLGWSSFRGRGSSDGPVL